VVCTAHTQDDQIETVLMRLMRDAGARGLASLAAPSRVIRPLLAHTRSQLVMYARAARVQWTEDPSNASRLYLRNRVRHDLLPALRVANADIGAELLEIGERAAAWRAEAEAFVREQLGVRVYERHGWLDVPARFLSTLGPHELRVLWPAIAAMVGATLDRRALDRLVAFSVTSRVGSRIQLAGRWEVVRARDAFELRAVDSAHAQATVAAMPLSNVTTWGDWYFREAESCDAKWSACLPADQPLFVRAWRAGDRLAADSGREKKVKELLTGAGVTGHLRAGWPVVLAGDQIVWVPGVGRSEAATARPGRPGLPFFCEYISR
jgi:tRNA(Ile)-lysidine synthase